MSRAKERLKGGKETKDSVTLLPCFYFVELPILASSVVSLYFLELTDIFQPVHSGYSCNDRSLSLPYILPRQEVCPLPLLFSLAFAVPTVTILIGEAVLYCYLSRRSSSTQTEANINAAGCTFNSYIRRAVRFIGIHIFGLCVTALITDILQLSTGQHTPYWLEVCKPNLTHINMSSCDEAFILEDICSGQDLGLITAGRKSFPSQHATLAAFAAVYVSMYFNTVLTDSAKLLKPLLVFSFIMLAILAGLTRIIQFRNHPVDVYCGWFLGAAIAVYLGVYAVGNFQPSEDRCRSRPLPPILREPPLSSLPNVSQAAVSNSHQGHRTLVPSPPKPIITRTTSHSLSPDQPIPILTRSSSYREPSMSNLKRTSAEVEVITTSSPPGNHDNMMTFSSSTLPRSHGGSSLEEGRIPRRHAAIHASMDSTRSKQLLSQWKNKNDNRKMSLQVMDGIRPPSSSSPQRNMELRCSSEPSAMGLEAELRAGAHMVSVSGQEAELRAGAHIPAQYMKLAASSVPINSHNHLVHNGSSGMAAGARVSIQPRPGSSQLVHIPEEENPTSKDQESESEDSMMDGGGSVREKWLRVAEKTTLPCRPLSAGGQPRLMQVIALSKQQGLLHSPRSEDGGSTVSCTGSIRYRALTDQDPSPPASTTGAMGGGGGGLERTGSIVRVEAHPESRQNKPVVRPPSTDGSGSWRWKPPEQRASLRQSTFALNDLNRHTDSCDSLRDGGSVDGRRSVTGTESESECGGEGGGGGGVYTNHPRVVHPLHPLHPNNPNNFQHSSFIPNNPSNPNFNNVHPNFNLNSTNSNMTIAPPATFAPPFHPHPQAVTTIRVTPVETTAASTDGGSDSQSVASSSRESTLRRKGSSNNIHVPDRGPTTDLQNHHRSCDETNRLDHDSSNRFHENLRNFQENPIQPNFPNRQMQGLFGRPSPTPPPTLPRPILTHTPPPNFGLAYKE
ncbi:2-lysophosphatidate phosphatase PLPPR4-like [Kryptolebias marmoratus]|uniref:2-lysophosphatidate phosphatase PLPPR4-like n=1 Tax=Kryptolebias marmoratus TaxID=37003 RepID=UPI0007F8B608|nr:2-lysophosphatidate phosphatase PLPPR4-like [Kryptolebias marmoratus]